MSTIGKTKEGGILRTLFILYVFFLPFGVFFNLPTEGVMNLFKSLSLNIAIIGFCIIIGKEKRIVLPRAIKAFISQYLFMVLYSVVAALFLTIIITNQYESPLSCIVGDIALYLEMLISVYFVYYCLNNVADYNDIYNALNWQIVVSIGMGIVQLFAVMGPMASLYSQLTKIFHLVTLDRIIEMERGVTLFGGEPSALTMYCFVTIPYILYRFFKGEKNRLLFGIFLSLFVVIFLASFSTQTLVVFLAEIVCFIILILSKGKLVKPLYYIAFLSGIAMVMMVSSNNTKIEIDTDSNSLEYVILGKIVDHDNASTQMRASAVINDITIFKNNIFWGVGDGCQGFWYEKNVPDWCKESDEVQERIQGHIIPNGGGAFFPCYLSAYGLLGVFFLVLFIKRYRIALRKSLIYQAPQMLVIFRLSVIVMLFSCWYTVNFRDVPALFFMLTLPLCFKNN